MIKLNDYDMKPISCYNCENPIGEVDYDALVIRPLCGKYTGPKPEGDKILYTISHFQTNFPQKLVLVH